MQLIDKKLHQLISIHAPREGCDHRFFQDLAPQ